MDALSLRTVSQVALDDLLRGELRGCEGCERQPDHKVFLLGH